VISHELYLKERKKIDLPKQL